MHVNDEIVHEQFGVGRITRFNCDFIFAQFSDDEPEKIIKAPFIMSVNGAGKVSRHTTERLDSFVSAVAGKRITYKKLTKGTTWFDAEATA